MFNETNSQGSEKKIEIENRANENGREIKKDQSNQIPTSEKSRTATMVAESKKIKSLSSCILLTSKYSLILLCRKIEGQYLE